jgi:hypothetical protein
LIVTVNEGEWQWKKNYLQFDGIMKVNIIAYLGNKASDVGAETITLLS